MYEQLKNEMESIAKLLERFPEAVKPQAFDLLVKSFLGQDLSAAKNADASPNEQIPTLRSRKPHRRKAAAKRRAENAENASPPPSDAGQGKAQAAKAPLASRATGRKESYSIDGSLNLRGDGKSTPSFKEFYEDKRPDNSQAFNTAAIYYLEKIVGIKTVELRHVYTCYREVKERPPVAFRQSFINTKARTGFIELSEKSVSLTHRGQIFVEHDLPSAKAKK